MIGISIGVILSGRMMQKHPYKKLAVRGWLLTSVALFSISLIFTDIGVIFIYFFAFLTGFGIGSVMPTFMLPDQNAVSENYQATVGGMIQLSKNIDGAAGILVLFPSYKGLFLKTFDKVLHSNILPNCINRR
ncbi:hypothetical protein VQL36_20295 [Chengkuizengella sp. SCS-71B]|uniref:hypothetical protein n=1 Tax=Chengkuizengella sp. SCS-71B TaxID=3115290 RepID=UPI0032C24872